MLASGFDTAIGGCSSCFSASCQYSSKELVLEGNRNDQPILVKWKKVNEGKRKGTKGVQACLRNGFVAAEMVTTAHGTKSKRGAST